MKKILSDEQKNLLTSAEDRLRHPFTKKFFEELDSKIGLCEDILLGKTMLKDLQTGYIENIDEVKYSKSSTLRDIRTQLIELKQYTTKLEKQTGVIS
jgi:hypothetical protein